MRAWQTTFVSLSLPVSVCLSSVRPPVCLSVWASVVSVDHKVRTYKEYHSVCPSSELGLPPTPHPQASVPPPPCFWGEGNTRWQERGWESPNSDEGRTLWYSLYVRTLWCRLSVCLSAFAPASNQTHGPYKVRYTDKKGNKIFLIYKEIQMGPVAKSFWGRAS